MMCGRRVRLRRLTCAATVTITLDVKAGDIGYVMNAHYPLRLVLVMFPIGAVWVRAEDVQVLWEHAKADPTPRPTHYRVRGSMKAHDDYMSGPAPWPTTVTYSHGDALPGVWSTISRRYAK
jgi:hypothetical protein